MKMTTRGGEGGSGGAMRSAMTVAVLVLMVASSALAIGLTTNGTLSLGSPGAPHGSVGAWTGGSPATGSGARTSGGNLGAFNSNFFTSSALPLPPSATRPCSNQSAAAACPLADQYNVSNDPTSVYTSNGILAVAYTSLTDDSPCAAAHPTSVTNIALETSSNQGSTWSTVQYLGSSDCSTASQYPSAWQPSITALGNGTLVLAYVEYNSTGKNATGGDLPPAFSTSVPPVARLVLTMSYTNGATWTVPQVLNVSTNPAYTGVSFVPALPSVAASGKTIYLAWERLGSPYSSPMQNSQIAVLVSTNGGSSWSPTLSNFEGGSGYSWSQNPVLMVNPAGEVFLAYDSYYYYNTYATEMYVSTTVHNGTVWTDNSVGFFYDTDLLGEYVAPVPSLAWDSEYGIAYLTFASMQDDQHDQYTSELNFLSSTNGGVTWSSSLAANSAVYDPSTQDGVGDYGALSAPGVYETSVAVDATGNVYVSALVKNGSMCLRNQCGVMEEVVVNTTDNGTTFSAPVMVNGAVTPGNSTWFGEYTSLVAAAGTLFVAYPQLSCPVWPALNCSAYPGSDGMQSQVEVGMPFSGAGTSVTFRAVGLPASENWTVILNGVSHQAGGTSAIVVSGIPTGTQVMWIVSGLNATPELRYYAMTQTVSWMSPISSSVTDTVSFSSFFPVEIGLGSTALSLGSQVCGYNFIEWYSTVLGNDTYVDQYECTTALAPVPACSIPDFVYLVQTTSGGPYVPEDYESRIYCSNLAVNTALPIAQVEWLLNGTTFTASEAVSQYETYFFGSSGPCSSSYVTAGGFVYCDFNDVNVTFVSWTGTGSASVTTNQSMLNVKVTGPAFETLNVIATGGCSGYYENVGGTIYTNFGCATRMVSLNFKEHGLPSGVTWGVTVSNATTSSTVQATAPTAITLTGVRVGVIDTASAWTVPTATPGLEWVGSLVSGSLVEPPFTPSTMVVNYSLENVAGAMFNLTLNETGLPGGASWAYSLTNSATNLNQTLQLTGGASEAVPESYGTYSLSALPVAYTNSTGYYVAEIVVTVHDVNTTALFASGDSSTFFLDADANVTIMYLPQYWIETSATGGGTVSPSSQWVDSGDTVVLQATPATGMSFIGWTGSGPGSTGQSQRHSERVTIRPLGPVVEIAVFAPTPPPTYSATVQETGLPVGQTYGVELGETAYTGTGTWTIGNLSVGVDSLLIPYVYDNVTLGTRYTPSSIEVTPWAQALDAVTVSGGNGTITIAFATQYLVTLSATPGGTIVPAAGTSWVAAGGSLALSETPLPGDHFVAWSGSGIGARNTTATSFSLAVDGTITEAAQFQVNPVPPPATYTLTVGATGLPSGTGWNASVGTGAGVLGTGSMLTLTGLNGTYTLTVPAIAVGTGVRWVPTGSGQYPVSVDPSTGNASYNVTFTEQFLVVAQVSGAGTATPLGSEWVNANSTVSLTASANSSWEFANWTGIGVGSYTGPGASQTLTVTGPVTEIATFIPVPVVPKSQTNTTSSTAGLPLALGLLVVLLVIGFIVGMVLVRRRPPPPAPVETWESSPAEGEATSEKGTEGGSD